MGGSFSDNQLCYILSRHGVLPGRVERKSMASCILNQQCVFCTCNNHVSGLIPVPGLGSEWEMPRFAVISNRPHTFIDKINSPESRNLG